MPSSMKILGQFELSTISFATTLYTVPQPHTLSTGTGRRFQTIVSSIVLCNRHSSANLYSIRVVPYEATAGVEHIIFNSVAMGSNVTDIVSLGMTLESGDLVQGFSSAANLSVSVFGIETS